MHRIRHQNLFADRAAAGDALAEQLTATGELAGRDDVVVLGLPRGGVVVAARVAHRLGAPLDVVVVRKLRAPSHRELAMGALAVWGTHTAVVEVEQVIANVDLAAFDAARLRELDVARQRAAAWSPHPPELRGRTAVLVDDGLATGATMRAAIAVTRAAGVARVLAAAPVCAPETLHELPADDVVCVRAPQGFLAVGAHYRDFREVTDDTVAELLHAAAGGD